MTLEYAVGFSIGMALGFGVPLTFIGTVLAFHFGGIRPLLKATKNELNRLFSRFFRWHPGVARRGDRNRGRRLR